jgi:hypothetical protein
MYVLRWCWICQAKEQSGGDALVSGAKREGVGCPGRSRARGVTTPWARKEASYGQCKKKRKKFVAEIRLFTILFLIFLCTSQKTAFCKIL